MTPNPTPTPRIRLPQLVRIYRNYKRTVKRSRAKKHQQFLNLGAQLATKTQELERITQLHRGLMAEADRRVEQVENRLAEVEKDVERLLTRINCEHDFEYYPNGYFW